MLGRIPTGLVIPAFTAVTAVIVVLVTYQVPQFWRAFPFLSEVSTGNYLRVLLLGIVVHYLGKRREAKLQVTELMLIITFLGYYLSIGMGSFLYGIEYVDPITGGQTIALNPYRIFKGATIVIILVVIFNSERKLEVLGITYFGWSCMTALMMFTGIATSVGDLLGANIVDDRYYAHLEVSLYSSGLTFYRESFWNLDPNYYGSLLSLGILIGICYLVSGRSGKWKWPLLGCVAIMALVMLGTGSRTGLSVTLVGIFIYFALSSARTKVRMALFIGGAVVLVISAIIVYGYEVEFTERYFEPITVFERTLYSSFRPEESSIASRTFMIKEAWMDYVEGGDLLFGSKGQGIGLFYYHSINHAELLNILGQFGLVTIVPYALFHILLFRRLRIARCHVQLQPNDGHRLAIINLACALQGMLLTWQLLTPTDDMLFFSIGILLATIHTQERSWQQEKLSAQSSPHPSQEQFG